MNLTKIAMLAVATLAFTGSTFAQEAESPKTEKETVKKIALTEDGKLTGKVFVTVEGEVKPVEARVVLAKDGVVVDSVQTDEEGLFAFANMAPGTYQMYGASDGFFGGDTVSVGPVGAPSYDMGLASAPVYDSFSMAPASGGGGFGGGGLAGNRRLLRLGLIGGIIAIAVSDASPED